MDCDWSSGDSRICFVMHAAGILAMELADAQIVWIASTHFAAGTWDKFIGWVFI